jgi:hypothetical protein
MNSQLALEDNIGFRWNWLKLAICSWIKIQHNTGSTKLSHNQLIKQKEKCEECFQCSWILSYNSLLCKTQTYTCLHTWIYKIFICFLATLLQKPILFGKPHIFKPSGHKFKPQWPHLSAAQRCSSCPRLSWGMPGKIHTSQGKMVWITLAIGVSTSGQVFNSFLICLRP